MSSRIPKMEVTVDNVRFKEVPDKRQGVKIGSILTLSNVKMSESVADYINNPDDRFYTLVNAVDIDWNAVVIDENLELHTTSDLIKWIKSIASGGIDPSDYYDKDTINELLEGKADSSTLSEVAISGSYNDLKDTPQIPEQVLADWNEDDNTSKAYIKNKPNLSAVATSGSYNDLSHTPAIPDAQVQSNWNESDTTKASYIKNKPNLATVATTGSYKDLSDTPTIPNEQIQSNWSQTDTSAKDYIKNKPTIPTKTSQLTNDSSFITSADIPEGAAASSTTPKEDGVANVGSELTFARGDHRHPHDSTKADISSLASVATSGNYNDLENKPTIPDAQIQSDWNQTNTAAKDYINNKPTLAAVATSGSFADLTNKPSYTKSDVGLNNVLNVEQIPATEKGTANGVATLGSDGKVPSNQLPSYVDDVVEHNSRDAFPLTGETGKIYVATDTNKTYRWSGSTYVEISESLALGETSSTAFAGDRGKAIEQKLQGIESGAEINVLSDWTESDNTKDSYIKNKPTIPTKTSQLTNDSDFVTSNDIPQVPTDIIKYTEQNLTDELKAQARSNIGAGASGFSGDYNDLTNKPDLKTVATSGSYNDLLNKPTIPDAQILSDWNQTISTSKDYIKNKPTIPTKTSQLTNDSSFITSSDIPEGAAASNTTPKEATNGGNKGTETAFARGDHSHPHDSTKLNVIDSNSKLDASLIDDTNSTNKFVTTSEKATWNTKQNAISDLQTIRDGAAAGATAIQSGDLATVAITGNYTDLNGKPLIPAAQIQSDWDLTTTTAKDYIKNKPELATVATSGSYNDLTDTPSLGTAASKDSITTVTLNSNKLVTSGAVYSELQGKQATINSSNKISADFVDDSSSDNKFVTASQKTTWSNKQDAINDLADIRSGATAGSTALQPEDISSWAKQSTKPSYTANEVGAIPSTEKGTNGGVATLDSTGKVPSSQLPSYVDDVLEYNNQSAFPATGESGKIYIAKDTNKTYRWSGTAYVEISESLALGENASTAFAGDRGKAIEDKVANIESGAQKNIKPDWNATAGSAAEILNKPTIPEGAEASSTSPKMDGTASVGEESKFARGDHRHPSDTTKANKDEMSITAGTGANADKTTIQLMNNVSATVLTQHQDISGKVDKVTGKGLSTNDYTTIEKNKLAGIEAGAQVHIAPTKTEVTAALGYTPPQTNTTYQFEQDGNSLKMGTDGGNKTSIYTPSFSAPVTSVAGKTGAVTLAKSDVGLSNVGNFKAVSTEANQGLNSTEKAAARANIGAGTSNFSGSYNDLTNKPTIPTDTNQKVKAGSVTFGNDDVVEIEAGSNVTVTGNSSIKKITIAATDTTYESKAAASGGTAVSLVTTGEKYNWNNKQDKSKTYDHFEEEILENGSIVAIDGSYLETMETVRTKEYYSLNGLSEVTFSPITSPVLPYNIFYYDDEFYYMGCSDWRGDNALKIPSGAKWCRMALYVGGIGATIDTIGNLGYTSNILSQPSTEYEPSFNELKKQEGTEIDKRTINVNSLTACGYAIKTADNTWLAVDPNRYGAAIIPVNHKGIRYDHIHIKANSDLKISGSIQGFLIAFLTGYDVNDGRRVLYSSTISTTITSQITAELEEDIPSDAVWIYVYLNGMDGDTPIDWRPVSLSFSKENNGLARVNERVNILENREYNTFISSDATKLKVCTWNIGHFYNGSIMTTYNTELDYQTIKAKVRDLLYGVEGGEKIRADIISLNEASDVITTKDGYTHSVTEDIFPFYARCIVGKTKRYTKNIVYSNVALYQSDKYIPITNQYVPSDGSSIGLTYFTDTYLMESIIRLGGLNVFLVTIHIPGSVGTKGTVDYTTFANFIIKRYKDRPRVILLGDFNTYSTQYTAYETAGFTVLNKSLNTHYNSDTGEAHIIDNVVYKGVEISDLKVYTEPNSPAYPDNPAGHIIVSNYPVGISDHYPMTFTVTASRPTWCPIGTQFYDVTYNKDLRWTGDKSLGEDGWVDSMGNHPNLMTVLSLYTDNIKNSGFRIDNNGTLVNDMPTRYYGALIDVQQYRGMSCFMTRCEENPVGYTFLKNSTISSGDTAQWATGYETRYVVSADKVFTPIPDDATYLYVYMHSQSMSDEIPHDFRPKKIEIGNPIINS